MASLDNSWYTERVLSNTSGTHTFFEHSSSEDEPKLTQLLKKKKKMKKPKTPKKQTGSSSLQMSHLLCDSYVPDLTGEESAFVSKVYLKKKDCTVGSQRFDSSSSGSSEGHTNHFDYPSSPLTNGRNKGNRSMSSSDIFETSCEDSRNGRKDVTLDISVNGPSSPNKKVDISHDEDRIKKNKKRKKSKHQKKHQKDSLTSEQNTGETASLTSEQNTGEKDSLTSEQNTGETASLTSEQNTGETASLTSEQNTGETASLTSEQNTGEKDSLTSEQNTGEKDSLTSEQNTGEKHTSNEDVDPLYHVAKKRKTHHMSVTLVVVKDKNAKRLKCLSSGEISNLDADNIELESKKGKKVKSVPLTEKCENPMNEEIRNSVCSGKLKMTAAGKLKRISKSSSSVSKISNGNSRSTRESKMKFDTLSTLASLTCKKMKARTSNNRINDNVPNSCQEIRQLSHSMSASRKRSSPDSSLETVKSNKSPSISNKKSKISDNIQEVSRNSQHKIESTSRIKTKPHIPTSETEKVPDPVSTPVRKRKAISEQAKSTAEATKLNDSRTTPVKNKLLNSNPFISTPRITRISGDVCDQLHDGNKVSWGFNKQIKDSMKERGTPVRTGTWLPEEDEFLRENLASYQNDNPTVDIHELLFSHDTNKDTVTKRLRIIKSTYFYQQMCLGLMRTSYDCYQRVRKVVYSNREFAGAFSADDERRLRELHVKYGSNWSKIGINLCRSSQSVFDKWKNMQRENVGMWSECENGQLVEAVEAFIKARGDDTDNVHNSMPWSDLCKLIPGRSATQCREHWMFQLRTHFLIGVDTQEKWNTKYKQLLIEEIVKQNVAIESEVDFDVIRYHFECKGRILSTPMLRRYWKRLTYLVDGHTTKSFQDILGNLVEDLP